MDTATISTLEPHGTHLETYPTRDAWLAARRGPRVGASDAAVILGLSQWKSPLALYYEKLGELPPSTADDDARAAERREWGLLLETPIATRYAAVTHRHVGAPAPFSMLVSKRRPWATASIDRWVCGLDTNAILPPNGLPPIAPLQIKMAGSWVASEWQDDEGLVTVPLTYQMQVQHEMMVTGAKWASVAVLIGGNELKWADVLRDDKVIDVIAEHEATFVEQVKARTPPTADGHETTRQLLRALNPKDDGTTVSLMGTDAFEWHQQLARIKAKKDELQADEDMLKNMLIQAIGPHSFAELGQGVRYSYKWQGRKEYTVKTTEFRVLRQTK